MSARAARRARTGLAARVADFRTISRAHVGAFKCPGSLNRKRSPGQRSRKTKR